MKYWKKGLAVFCSAALASSIIVSASAAAAEDGAETAEKTVIGRVVEIADGEVTLEVAGNGLRLDDCFSVMPIDTVAEPEDEAPPETEQARPEKPDGEEARPEKPEAEEGRPVTPDGEALSELPKAESKARPEKDDGKTEARPEDGEEARPVTPDGEALTERPEDGAEALPEKPGEEPAQEPVEEQRGVLVLSTDDLADVEVEIGDLLRVVIDGDGSVISVEVLGEVLDEAPEELPDGDRAPVLTPKARAAR